MEISVDLSGADEGEILVLASADNAVDYQFFADHNPNALARNTSGEYTYEFVTFGIHHIEIRAYGSSGKYLSKTREVSVLAGNGVSTGDGYQSPMAYDGFDLAWNDEFEGNSVKTENWIFEIGAGGWGNNELQYYRKSNASVKDGTLIIEARKQAYEGESYTSSRMITKGLRSFKYGRVDIRALLPKGQGIWPALWMLGTNISSVSWPACGEIDIMEMIGGEGRDNTIHGTLHWAGSGGEHASTGGPKKLAKGTYADEYHVFSIIWDEQEIKWLMNGEQYYHVSIQPGGLEAFHRNFFFIFNLAVGGNWPGNPNATTLFPQQMKVDYIRVFQKK